MSFTRMPVRFLQHNEELLKSMSGDDAAPSNYVQTENPATVQLEPSYRFPAGRVHGNEFFRRYPDGSLDLNAAKETVISALFKVKDGIPPNGVEAIALSVLFPTVFDYVDQSMLPEYTTVSLRLHPMEAMQVAALVAEHLQELMDYKKHKRQ